jgi:hypothetical protein
MKVTEKQLRTLVKEVLSESIFSQRPTKIGSVNGWDVMYTSRVVGRQDPTQVETFELKYNEYSQPGVGVRNIKVVVDGQGGYEVRSDNHREYYHIRDDVRSDIAHLTDGAVSWDKIEDLMDEHMMSGDEDPMGGIES